MYICKYIYYSVDLEVRVRGVAHVEGPAGVDLHHGLEPPGPEPLGRRQKVACSAKRERVLF